MSRRAVSQRRAVSGFTLVTVIFLLVVVSGLVVYITNIGVVQQTTVVYGLQGARALQAARSAIEWGIFQSINNAICAGSTTINDAAFAGFSVEVQCIPTTHIEGDPVTGTIITYRLSAIASSGVYGSLDYLQRRLQASVSLVRRDRFRLLLTRLRAC